MPSVSPSRFLSLLLASILLCLPAAADSKNQVFEDFTTPLPLQPGDVLVLGIVGGWERWDAERIVRRAALKVREQNWQGVYAETVENHKMQLAWQLLNRALDWNKNGTLDDDEKKGARLIVYGQSLGGSAAMRFARELKELDIPVLLVVLVDSYGGGDRVVPSNVAAAMNIYQRDHLVIRGEKKFVAEDPEKTTILGNHRVRYRGRGAREVNSNRYKEEAWHRRVFLGAHLKIEYDEVVNRLLQETILEHIPADRKIPRNATQ
jgi:pimeloyl-ACP methyl ester carboxylesterase